ncbi:MAG: type II toxin-antitoxin system RelE/ParE family toxin [Phycisphaerae bacterium]|nr:type II toxin-antitoxin system RelE/ParE family toxin [Phycisphaerae bacterium]
MSIKSAAKRGLKKLQTPDQVRVATCIDGLAENPFPAGVQKLKGTEKGVEAWRVRVGSFRIVYQVDTDANTIEVYQIADRKDVYKKR